MLMEDLSPMFTKTEQKTTKISIHRPGKIDVR